MHRLERAFDSKHRAGGRREKDFDMAIISMRLEGRAQLVALHYAAGFPEVTMVYEKIKERSVCDST